MEKKYYSIKISCILVFIYLLQLIAPEITQVLGFRAAKFPTNFFSIFTSFFIHSVSDYMHLINNLFFLAIFGTLLEYYIGSKKFLLFYISAGLFANLSAFIHYPNSLVLGASGAISGIISFLAVLRPKQLGIFWGAPLPMWVVGLLWFTTNYLSIGANAGIAFEAHLYGLFFGFIVGIIFRKPSLHKENVEKEIFVTERDIREWEKEYMEG